MQLAVNFSFPLVRLIQDGSIKVDRIKIPDWDGMLIEAGPYGPLAIHFDLDIGFGNTLKADFERIKNLQTQTNTPHVNTHLVAPRHFNPASQKELRDINHLWREELNLMRRYLGDTPVAVENSPYTPDAPHLSTPARSDVISRVIQETGSMLLLDLSHARITADTLGVDVKDYIQSLPLDRLVELHITGVKPFRGILTDHFELMDADWEILEWALSEIQKKKWREPAIVAFEYGGIGNIFAWRTELRHLKSQVPVLYAMIHNYSRPH